MKKLTKVLTLIISLLLAVSLFGCGSKTSAKKSAQTTEAKKSSATTETPVKVLSHEEFIAAESGEDIAIEAYVQGKQYYNSWGNTSLYLQDDNGGYYVYRWYCTEEEYNAIEIGDKVKVVGEKGEWAGEHEVAEATAKVQKLDAEPKFYDALDCTDLLGTDDLIKHQNEFVKFTALKVVESVANSIDPETQQEVEHKGAFLYNWDGSGERGSDIYFNVTDGKNTYQFLIESDLCNKDSNAYKMAETLEVGDYINVEGFLFWYNGLNPHINYIEKIQFVDHAGYVAAEKGELIIFEAYVQQKQIYNAWGNTSLYLQDEDGGYFVYRWYCSEEEYNAVTPGKKVRVIGEKTAWAGQHEIAEGTAKVEVLDDEPRIFDVYEVKNPIDQEALLAHQCEYVVFDVTVLESVGNYTDSETQQNIEKKGAFLYNWDGSGQSGSDLYITVTDGTNNYQFVVESDLIPSSSDLYQFVESDLKIGDHLEIYAMLYWYNGINPHIVAIVLLNK